MDIAGIEDILIKIHEDLALFAQVESFGRKGEPELLALPGAMIYFNDDGEDEEDKNPRPIDDIAFHVVIRAQNVASEAAAARDAYTLIDASRKAVRGKTLGIPGIEPFRCAGRKLTDYSEAAGWIEYTLRFVTRQYQPIVTE